ncbi:aconitate hydratase AcnA [Granulosicoccus sp. 3-233]|uniref:aconitate hydratase AcnA n=1 Tax=Granulosicoccus sp. 3-233 TaxID=3417969 RepID=UPI003D3272D1
MNSFGTRSTLDSESASFQCHRLDVLEDEYRVSRLPYSLKIMLENLLRNENGGTVTSAQIEALLRHDSQSPSEEQIAFTPARVILQDFTGVPAIVDLAAMRDAIRQLGGDPETINPLERVDLVIDHSVMVDKFGTQQALDLNTKLEFQRNRERYQFLRWGQQAFENFRVVPPGTGIVHQVNLEYLADVVSTKQIDGETWIYPDTLVGTDSHTTMINGLGVLGWGVGGIEAEAAMLGQPMSMLIPDVVGVQLIGSLPAGATATDLVLKVTQMLREHGVVGKFVEFHGDGLSGLPLADRATIGNMAPEYGATCGIFPVDAETLKYLELSGRDAQVLERVESYARMQGLWREDGAASAEYTESLTLNLDEVVPSIAGPKRPQDRIALRDSVSAFRDYLDGYLEDNRPAGEQSSAEEPSTEEEFVKEGGDSAIGHDKAVVADEVGPQSETAEKGHELQHGDIVIAAITSCTNTSNPYVMMAAGLLAKRASEKGLTRQPWVKTSLAPGSQVVTGYLEAADLMQPLQALGFNVVGFGCTTCIGNSGPLDDEISDAIKQRKLVVSSVLSGNRNFEGRIHQQVRTNYLASPPLVVAYALAGSMLHDFDNDPLGSDADGNAVYLKDIWPSPQEIADLVAQHISSELFRQRYSDVFDGTDDWHRLDTPDDKTYTWPESSYIKQPPFFTDMTADVPPLQPIEAARCLVMVGDSVTTDHISPAGAIGADSAAGQYLDSLGIKPGDFNSYGSRRGNHEVMMRGTFANVRLRNLLVPGVEGGYTRHFPETETVSIFDAAMQYQQEEVPLVVLAGKEYGTGSSRDWAAKGVSLLGVRAVIAEGYERIHRSNLVGFGVLPLQFLPGEGVGPLELSGEEGFTISSLDEQPDRVTVSASTGDGETREFEAIVRVDTDVEWDYLRNGGILHYVLRQLAAKQ